MKKITLLILLISFQLGYSQVLNQPANWPNENWTTSGEYTATGLIAEPSTSDSFTFDDDAAGNTSLADVIASESPIIDLTAAFNAGETFITISGDFSHYDIGGYLAVEYFDADANDWVVNLQSQLESTTTTATDYQNCENLVGFEESLAISNFTANQLENFKYRFSYNDTQGWQWGFCIKNPSVISSANFDCPEPDIFSWTMGSVSASFNGTNNSAITSYEIEYNQGDTFTPGDGTAQSYTFNEFPHTLPGLEPGTLYYFTIRSICADGNFSEWSDNPDNGDGPDAWSTFEASGDCPDEYELPIVWRDNFECHDAFAIDNIEGWTVIDNDGGETWGASDANFTNESYVGAGIIWNNMQATTDAGTAVNENYNTYEGEQGLYFIASGANSTTFPNDDWMIGPEFTISGVNSPTLSFWAKSLTADYGLERFQIAIGSSTDPTDFTVISSPITYVEAPVEWTQYEYDLSAYDGQTIRVGIHYVGNDSFVLQMDSFVVEGTLGINDVQALDMNIYPNPVNGNFVTIQTPVNGVKYVEVFDITGKRLINTSLSVDTLEVSSLSAGMYLIKVTVEGQSKTSKLVVR
ncbi:choice-of-anchor J domain-containing protein [Flavobacteriaceae bacterium]|nr:choice-of-anchor J domain-containing protein [Flavobacteriaceae bacterium]